MNKTTHLLDYEQITRLLEDFDEKYVFEKVNLIPKEYDLKQKLTQYVDIENINRKSVLGIDIYKYSAYEKFEQSLVPFMFKILFKEKQNCLNKFELEF